MILDPNSFAECGRGDVALGPIASLSAAQQSVAMGGIATVLTV